VNDKPRSSDAELSAPSPVAVPWVFRKRGTGRSKTVVVVAQLFFEARDLACARLGLPREQIDGTVVCEGEEPSDAARRLAELQTPGPVRGGMRR
jgi:hypothetical protein